MTHRLYKILILVLCMLFCAAFAPAAIAEDAGIKPVKVVFSYQDKSILVGLHVTDADGNACAPTVDAETGAIQYGTYALMPGSYRYTLHDERGRYEDLDGSFTLNAAVMYILPLDPTPVVEIQSFSFTYIDPIYSDVLTEADFPETSIDDEAVRSEMQELAAVLNGSSNRKRARYFWDQNTYYDSIEAAGADLRDQIMAYESLATVHYISETAPIDDDTAAEIIGNIWAVAVRHTGIPTEGDYLRYEFGGYTVNSYSYDDSENGVFYCTFVLNLFHFSDAGQEAALSPVVENILAGLNLDGKSDYQKILAIYDYLCTNVSYGGTDYLKYTAYGALINKKAVCQGISSAFYRLCLASGVDTRIMTSSQMKHAWNIAALGGQYYELDATWDAHRSPASYLYFLKGSRYWLSRHTQSGVSVLGDQFYRTGFADEYVLPTYSFSDLQSIPVSSEPSQLGQAISGFEDILAALAAASGEDAESLDSIRLYVAADADPDVSGDETIVYDIFPAAAVCIGESVAAVRSVGSGQLDDEVPFTLSLPVSEAWAGRRLVYILRSEGYPEENGTAAATLSDGLCCAALGELRHFGRLTLELQPHTVSFRTDGSSTYIQQRVPDGEKAVRPADPAKAGAWFDDWYADQEFSALFDFETRITADTVVYAQWVTPDLVLPSALTVIGSEAFAEGAFTFVKLPDQTRKVESRAFAACTKLKYIFIPASVTEIDPSAFDGVAGLTIFGQTNSTAASFAAKHSIRFRAVS